MTENHAVDAEKPSCGFNYCFWSKLLVAIPAFPIIAFVASSFFQSDWAKLLAAIASIGLTVYLARVIDSIPYFKRCFIKRPDVNV